MGLVFRRLKELSSNVRLVDGLPCTLHVSIPNDRTLTMTRRLTLHDLDGTPVGNVCPIRASSLCRMRLPLAKSKLHRLRFLMSLNVIPREFIARTFTRALSRVVIQRLNRWS